MYDLITVANKAYYPFLRLFIESLFRNTDTKNLGTLLVVNAGGLQEYKGSIERDKVLLIGDDHEEPFGGVHSQSWINVIKLKTKSVLDNLDRFDGHSLIMIDCDVFVVRDFHDVVDYKFDIQFTTMKSGRQINAAGIPIKEIACFTVFNNIPMSVLFVRDWIAKIDELSKTVIPPYETPAMNMIIAENRHQLLFGYLNESEVCADMCYYPDTRIVHLKSNGGTKNTPEKNFYKRIQTFKSICPKNIYECIDLIDMEKWSNSYGK
jgi:hypothetical protein